MPKNKYEGDKGPTINNFYKRKVQSKQEKKEKNIKQKDYWLNKLLYGFQFFNFFKSLMQIKAAFKS